MLIDFAQQVAVLLAVRDKFQPMGDAGRGIFSMVGHKQQLGFTFANQDIHKAADQLTVERIQPLQRFVKNQQRRVLDQRADDQCQPLLPPRQAVEWRIGDPVIHTQNIQPLLRQLVLLVGYRLINTNGVEEAREDHVSHRGAHPVVQVQAAADIADVLFDIPDGFPAAAATAEQGEIVAVSLRVIPGDQAQQRGFTRPVGADDLPVLTRLTVQLR